MRRGDRDSTGTSSVDVCARTEMGGILGSGGELTFLLQCICRGRTFRVLMSLDRWQDTARGRRQGHRETGTVHNFEGEREDFFLGGSVL